MSSNKLFGYIYLLLTRESFQQNEQIYKIGRTTKTQFERFNQYPKGSILYLQIICVDCVSLEAHLLKLFTETFERCERCRIYGKEYFKGDPSIMMQMILDNMNFSCDLEQNHIIKQEFNKITNDKMSLQEELGNMKDKCQMLSNKLGKANESIVELQNKFHQDSMQLNNEIFELKKEVISNNCEISNENEVEIEVEIHKDNPLQCPKCSRFLSSNQVLKRHLEICKGVHSLQCPKCKKEFSSRYGKYNHLKNVQCVQIHNNDENT